MLRIRHPDLAPHIDDAPGTAISGSTILLQWSVDNVGSAAATGSWVDRILLSDDAIRDSSDLPLAERTSNGPLSSSSGYSPQLSFQLPISASGPKHLLLVTDADNTVAEAGGETGNVAAAAIQIELAPYADLAVSDVTAPVLVVGDPEPVSIS